jgi:hypothetical protein
MLALAEHYQSTIRAMCEHAIGMIKTVLGFTKLHYRRQAKKPNWRSLAAAPMNPFVVQQGVSPAV